MWKCPKCGRQFKKTGQSHYCGKPGNVDEYIGMCDEDIRTYLQQVRDVIREVLPDVEETISWGMPTYRRKQNLIHFAANRNHIGIYPGEEAVEAFADRLEGLSHDKGTIRISLKEPLPLELIRDIASWCGNTQ
ncbi:MAG: DUF1801 domain-containing protein [Solobacterium sp.]|nr:DUF1801 domain-containing protein [Solobacterium sp.]